MLTSQVPDSAKIFFAKGIDQSRQGNHQGAIASFDQALQMNSSHADAYGHRCVARYRIGDLQGAIADCQQAATLYLEQGKAKEHQYALKMLQRLQA